MWKQFLDFIRQVFKLTETTQDNSNKIKNLQAQHEAVIAALQRLGFEVQRLDERERHEREKLELRMEIERLRAERALPPAGKKKKKNAVPVTLDTLDTLDTLPPTDETGDKPAASTS